jgi:ribosomal protein L11 methyltransferase
MSSWIEVKAKLSSTPEDWAVWTEIFGHFEIFGTVQTDDPPTMSAYLAPGQVDKLKPLCDALLEGGAYSVEKRSVVEENWAETWKQFFKPTRIGENWIVRPTWEKFSPNPCDRVIVLDPGQAFGTGDHPTTRGCLEFMEDIDFRGKAVADIGCGTGILGVAAKLLGAPLVRAVDVDTTSVESCRQNAQRNGVCFEVFEGLGFEPLPEEETFDIVISNIISAALIKLAPSAAKRVSPGGIWLVSGIIPANWPDVLEAAEKAGFKLEDRKVEDEWVTALLRR